MNKTIEIDNEFVTLWYYPDAKIVHHKFHKFICGEPFREVLNKGVDIFIQNGAIKWLSDDRNNNALPSEDIKFATEDWAPRVVKAGWKYWGLIMPDKVVGKMNMRRIIDSFASMGVKVEIFESPDEGLKWLASVN